MIKSRVLTAVRRIMMKVEKVRKSPFYIGFMSHFEGERNKEI